MSKTSNMYMQECLEDGNPSQESVAYRLVPLKIENSDHLSEMETTVSPMLTSNLNVELEDSTSSNSTVLVSGGQIYLLSEPTTVTSTTRSPRLMTQPTISNNCNTPRVTIPSKEEKRRVTHNEVERRRRDKINNWICVLAKIIPECPEVKTKCPNPASKGFILSKACEYIQSLQKQLKNANDKLKEVVTASKIENEKLKEEIQDLKARNNFLREQFINCDNNISANS